MYDPGRTPSVRFETIWLFVFGSNVEMLDREVRSADSPTRSCLLVEVVHVLSAEEKAVFQPLLKPRKCEVRRVGFRRQRDPPTHRVELSHQPGIAEPRMRRGDLLYAVVPPQSADTTERRYTTPALMPAPVRMKTLSLGAMESTDQVYLRPVPNLCRAEGKWSPHDSQLAWG